MFIIIKILGQLVSFLWKELSKISFAVFMMCMLVLLLVSAAFPFMAQRPDIYSSAGIFFALGGLAVSLLLCTLRRRFKWSKLGFYLTHLSVIVLLGGALTGYLKAENIEYGHYVGKRFATNQLFDNKHPDTPVNLDFSFSVNSFDVRRGDPTFMLYENSEGEMKELAKLELIDGALQIPNGKSIQEAELRDFKGNLKPHMFIDESLMLFSREGPDAWYAAELSIQKGKDEHTELLEINNPTTIYGWKFYLMSYGQDQRGQYVALRAKRDPGRPFVIFGMILLMIGTAIICLFKKVSTEDAL